MDTSKTNTASEARLRANRENATKSTGPRTLAGRAISSRNATRHGLSSTQPFMPGEEPEGFDALVDDISSNFRPVGEAEEKLVFRIASLEWRLCRTLPMEAAILRDRMNFDVADRDKFRKIRHDDLIQYAIEDEEPAPPPLPDPVKGDLTGRAFMADCRATRALSLLARYETSLERSLERCLCLLKHFQTVRLQAKSTPSKSTNCRTNPTPPPAPVTKPPAPVTKPPAGVTEPPVAVAQPRASATSPTPTPHPKPNGHAPDTQ